MSINRKPMELEWYPRYIDAYNTDDKVQGMTWAERGFYDFLLDMQWKHGSIPADRARLARWAKLPLDVFEATFGDMVNLCFAPVVDDPAKLQNPKIERVRIEQEAFLSAQSERQRERANKRWCRGIATAEPPHSHGNAEAMPGNANLKSEKRKEEIKIPPADAGTEQVKSPKQPSDTTRLLDLYCTEWVEVFKPADGKKPTVTKGDAVAADKLAKKHGLAEASILVRRYLRDPDKFLCNNGHALRFIHTRVDGYRATQKPSESADSRPRPKLYEKRYADDLGEP